ncbi:MAG TPA: glycosyltransferase family 2 protein [Syntrophorhabdaceae bacterium]
MRNDFLKLSIIIVTWNTENFVADCLASVTRDDVGVPHEIIVVDNASTDGTAAAVAQFGGVRFIQNESNEGFAKANNRAIREAKGEYLLLLNPDTIIPDPAIFKNWIAFMDRSADVGASGCGLVFPDGSRQVGDAGFKPGLITAFNFAFFLSRVWPRRCKGLFLNGNPGGNELDVDWICGADLLVRRSILPVTGLLNEGIFMYAEDVEWGCRIRSFGYRICYLPRLKIVHLQGGSADRGVEERISPVWLENLRRLYRTYHGGHTAFLFDVILAWGYLGRFLLYRLHNLRQGRDMSRRKARMMGAYAGYLLTHMFRHPADSAFFKKE